jgi:DNA invertase Pin-like site-specific DNA recombinase
MTGRNRRRPALQQALAAVRQGDTLVVPKLELKGKQPKLSSRQRVHVLKLVQAGDHTIAELAELFAVNRATIYREIARAHPQQTVR